MVNTQTPRREGEGDWIPGEGVRTGPDSLREWVRHSRDVITSQSVTLILERDLQAQEKENRMPTCVERRGVSGGPKDR